jgi:phospholipase C
VKNGQLPAVSWLVPSERLSDHPSSPWYGAWYVAEALDILTSNPEVWKKTIFVLNYDENDGYFDHVPPFVAPDPEAPASGRCSPGIDTAAEYLRLQQDLARQPAKEARGGPIGLGYRVPLLVASPWSRGGFVCSQVFDHTSVLQLLEKITSHRSGKQIRETNISSWRRTVCGDMTSVFRPFRGEGKPSLEFPPKDSFLEEIHRARFQKPPAGYRKLSADDVGAFERDRFAVEWMPQQERGVRPSAALPYQLYAEGGVSGDGAQFELVLEARNEVFGKASAGAPFHVYAPGDRRTRAYAVGAGQLVKDSWKVENDRYHLRVCGPNGFLREFAGGPGDPRASFRCEYSRRHSGDIEILVNSAGGGLTLHVTDNAYGTGSRTLTVQGGKAQTALFSLVRSHGWYDFSIRTGGQDAFLRRYAGRVEVGEAGFSDPFMGRV